VPKSPFASAVDEVQKGLRNFLKPLGFRSKGRAFNRVTDDGLTQLVGIQMGASDPPGTTYIPGLRENLHGLFTVNLGVYVPEVAKYHGGGEAGAWVQDYHCCVRSRLGAVAGEQKDLWWPAEASTKVLASVQVYLEEAGLPFLERFSTRDKIILEWDGRSENLESSSPPRIVSAIILCERGKKHEARILLERQALETQNPGHPGYVRKLAQKLQLGALDG
jgi:hypothetical protein